MNTANGNNRAKLSQFQQPNGYYKVEFAKYKEIIVRVIKNEYTSRVNKLSAGLTTIPVTGAQNN